TGAAWRCGPANVIARSKWSSTDFLSPKPSRSLTRPRPLSNGPARGSRIGGRGWRIEDRAIAFSAILDSLSSIGADGRRSIARNIIEEFEEALEDGFVIRLALGVFGYLAHESRAGHFQPVIFDDCLNEHIRHGERLCGRRQAQRASDRSREFLVLPLAG